MPLNPAPGPKRGSHGVGECGVEGTLREADCLRADGGTGVGRLIRM